MSFNDSYLGTPPWDIGHRQPFVEHIEPQLHKDWKLLDAGCGTGETTLYLRSQGYDITGVDAAPRAIAKAKAKAKDQQVDATFEVADLLRDDLGPFDAVIDCAVFHTFSDANRAMYVQQLDRMLKPGGRYYMMVFSDKEPGGWGPRRISKQEINEAFVEPWSVDSIEEMPIEVQMQQMHAVKGYLASIHKNVL